MFWRVAWRSLLERKGSVLLTMGALTLSILVLVGIEHLRQSARSGFARTVSGVDLIVGARTGDINLLLYSVFRLGNASNNIAWESYQKIVTSPDVAWSIPLSLGDSHKGYKVLGTNQDYFAHYRFAKNLPLTFTAGGPFTEVSDVVLGAEVARKLGIRQPPNGLATSVEQAAEIAGRIGYPVLVRPSYVLGGRGMVIVYDERQLRHYFETAARVSHERPVLIDRFLEDAFEADVDALCDGETVVIGGVMQHIEDAGIHSGDSACVLPPYLIGEAHAQQMREHTVALARTAAHYGATVVSSARAEGFLRAGRRVEGVSVRDVESGEYFDPAKLHVLDHKGKVELIGGTGTLLGTDKVLDYLNLEPISVLAPVADVERGSGTNAATICPDVMMLGCRSRMVRPREMRASPAHVAGGPDADADRHQQGVIEEQTHDGQPAGLPQFVGPDRYRRQRRGRCNRGRL